MKTILIRSLFLITIIQLSCHAEDLNSRLSYTYQLSESQTNGPTVAIIACNNNGPAGSLAIHQIEHWTPASGKIICIDMSARVFNNNKQSTLPINQLLNQYHPEFIIELWESYDYKASIPDANGATIYTYSSSQNQELSNNILWQIKAVTPETTKEYWHTEHSQSIPKTSIASELTDNKDLQLIQIVTTSKDKNDSLSLRTRQHRHAVYAILSQFKMTPSELSPDTMTSQSNNFNTNYIAVYDGPGAVSSSGHSPCWITQSMSNLENSKAILIGPGEIQTGALQQFDSVLFGGGSSKTQANGLGEQGMNEVRKFVKNGGRYVGICAGAFLASANSYALKLINAEMASGKGKEIITLNFTEKGQQILQAPQTTPCKYSSGPVNIHPANIDSLPAYEVLAYFDSMPSALSKYNNTPAVIAGHYGKGLVIAFSPHPERHPGPQYTLWNSLQP